MKESFEDYNIIEDKDKEEFFKIFDNISDFIEEYWYNLKSKYESMPEYRTDLRVLEIVIDDLLNTITINRGL